METVILKENQVTRNNRIYTNLKNVIISQKSLNNPQTELFDLNENFSVIPHIKGNRIQSFSYIPKFIKERKINEEFNKSSLS